MPASIFSFSEHKIDSITPGLLDTTFWISVSEIHKCSFWKTFLKKKKKEGGGALSKQCCQGLGVEPSLQSCPCESYLQTTGTASSFLREERLTRSPLCSAAQGPMAVSFLA